MSTHPGQEPNNKSERPKVPVPQWLQDLQENSWELELLISGGAIFSLFQLSDWYIDFIQSLKITNQLAGTNIFLILGMLGIKMLTLGFFLHLLLRSVWLSMVCVNFVFPQGIQNLTFKLKRPYKERFAEGDNMFPHIEKTDSAAGLLMFLSITSILVIAGALVLTVLLVSIPVILFNPGDLYISIMMLLMFLYYLDFFTFGLLRKIPVASHITYPFFRVIDYITFRRVLARPLRLFNSNVHKLKAAGATILLIIISGFYTYASIYPSMRWPNVMDDREHRWNMAAAENWMHQGNYMDEAKEGEKFFYPVIESQVVEKSFLKVFIPYLKIYDNDIGPGESIADNVVLYLDSIEIQQVEWFNYRTRENDQMGLLTHVDVSKLSRGLHHLFIENKKTEQHSAIPFWKDQNAQ